MSDEYESIVLVKPEVFVYRIPPLASSRGHKAADWKLDSPDYTCRLRLVARGPKLEVKLEDKSSGELFAKCPIDKYPGPAVEPVLDSSRYFVLRLQDDTGRTAFIGVGFADRGDSFDMNVALQDHFRYLEKSAKLHEEDAKGASNQPKLDLSFKAGQTITLNIGKKDGSGGNASSPATSRPRSAASANVGGPVPLLPPPPAAGSRIVASPVGQPNTTIARGRASPSSSAVQRQQQSQQVTNSTANPFAVASSSKPSDSLFDLDPLASALPTAPSKPAGNPFLDDILGDPKGTSTASQQTSTTANVGNLLDF